MKLKTKKEINNKAVGYIRISTTQQVESGLGLKAQIRSIEKHSKVNKYELTNIFEDEATSGALNPFNRDGFLDMLAYAKKNNINKIIIQKRDRLSRDMIDLQFVIFKKLPKLGLTLECVDEPINYNDPTVKLQVAMSGFSSENERFLDIDGTKNSLSILKNSGRVYTKRVIGLKKENGFFKVDKNEKNAIKFAIRTYKTAPVSYSQLTKMTNDKYKTNISKASLNRYVRVALAT